MQTILGLNMLDLLQLAECDVNRRNHVTDSQAIRIRIA